MARDPHRHQWTGYTLRLLTLQQVDGAYRVLLERRCRHCTRVERLTGSGTKTGARDLPPLETFWTTPRTKEA